MLRDLTIQNYRCFKNFHIDGLARVNLLVGMNNCGKTTLLEAVYLFVNPGNPQRLAYLLHNRGELVERSSFSLPGEPPHPQFHYQISHLFYGHAPSLNSTISFSSTQDQNLQVEIIRQKLETPQLRSQTQIITPFELVIRLNSQEETYHVPVYSDDSIEARWLTFPGFSNQYSGSSKPEYKFLNKSWFVPSNNLSNLDISAIWNDITLTPKEDQVIDALKILDKNIERISFTSKPNFNSGILLRRHKEYPIPLSSMGEGMRRILNLAMAAVTVENGVLLIDEIETGLYYEVQTDMWRFILEVANELNIQVFATTHSWDCICAFQEAVDEFDDPSVSKLFRLSRKGEDIRPVEYPADELSVAVRQSIEVR
ncbi:MAG: AAA family ATPase [Coleofasciculus sp. B1-GNL1-01]|uniref:AAA family ATPase n=1 Tax=Coleofasciculus sp. B1-GNL1-01 TaxID=3068484 RepID=UPI0032F68376